MKGCDIIGFGAISPLGAGSAAFDPGQRGEPAPTCVAEDAELASARLTKPHAARARLASLPPGHDRAKALLERATGELVAQLDERFPVWRGRRLGVCVGTSGGGMPSLVEAVRVLDEGELLAPELARAAPYFGPLSALTETLPAAGASWVQVLGACASSTYALGLGLRWLDLDAADIVIAGGYDALSTFIAAGFEC